MQDKSMCDFLLEVTTLRFEQVPGTSVESTSACSPTIGEGIIQARILFLKKLEGAGFTW